MKKIDISDNSSTQAIKILFCVFSVVLLQIFSLWWMVPATGEQREWFIFISLGVVFLPILWLVSVIDVSRFLPFKLSTVKIFILVLGIFPLTWVLSKTLSVMVVIFALGHWFALIYLLRREKRFNDIFPSLSLLFVVFVSWAFASRLIWWEGFDSFILQSPVPILVLLISSSIVFWILSDSPSSRSSSQFNLLISMGLFGFYCWYLLP